MIKNYIFDLDGTLCGSMTYWRAETAHLKDFLDEKEMEKAYEKMRLHYQRDIELKSGVIEMLENARDEGIRCCIASATKRSVSQPLLDKTGIMKYMEFYIDCHEIGGIFKERPDIYLLAAKKLGAEVRECAVFEDSEYCAKTAREAGFYVVGVYDEQTSKEGDCSGYSNLYIENFSRFAKTAVFMP